MPGPILHSPSITNSSIPAGQGFDLQLPKGVPVRPQDERLHTSGSGVGGWSRFSQADFSAAALDRRLDAAAITARQRRLADVLAGLPGVQDIAMGSLPFGTWIHDHTGRCDIGSGSKVSAISVAAK